MWGIGECTQYANPFATSSSGVYRVRWLDYKGNVIAQKMAVAGQTLPAPAPPIFPGLSWFGWSGSSVSVSSDIDIIGIWTPTDGYTHLFVDASTLAGNTPTLKVTKSDTSTLTVWWGDGTSSTSSASGNVALTKPVAYADGSYDIKFGITSGSGTFTAGYGTNGSPWSQVSRLRRYGGGRPQRRLQITHSAEAHLPR